MEPNARVSVTRRTLVAALHFFLCMTAYYVLKPVRESLFMHAEGANQLPKIHIVVAISTYFAAQLYDKLARTFRPGSLAANTTISFLLGLGLMWVGLRCIGADSPLYASLPWIFYVVVCLYGLFVVSLFWSLTHNAFLPEEGKIYYGWIGSGGILGGAAGAVLTRGIVHSVGTDNLLLVAAAILAPCLLTGRYLDGCRLRAKEEGSAEKSRPAWSLLWRNRYLGAIGALVAMTLFVEELGDHQNMRVLADAHLSKDQLTAFWSNLFGLTNVIGVLLNWGLAAFLQVRFGPLPGLALLQISTVLKTVTVYFDPSPQVITYMLSPELALHYSLFQSAKELLYTPCDAEVKYRGKTLVETFLFRFGISIAAMSVLFYFRYLVDMGQLVSTAVLVAFLNVGICIHLAREYRRLLNEQAST